MLALASVIALLVSPYSTPEAAAACRYVEQVRYVHLVLVSSLVKVCDGGVEDQTDNGPSPVAAVVSTVDLAVCLTSATLLDLDPETCLASDQPSVTPDIVMAAFARLPLPKSVLQVQPPNGRTLVNFDTNFLTERAPFTRTLTLLGQRVQLRVFAAQFTWRFDDGDPLTTTSPGAPYPDLQVTHDYQRTGTYAPSVDTTYAADWRVGGGAWQRVPGTVTIAGDPVALQAVEARPTLVGSYD